MNFEEIIKLATEEIKSAIRSFGIDNTLSFNVGEPLTDDDDLADGRATIEGSIKFTFGNIERDHHVLIGWHEDDGIGFEYGEDGHTNPITYGNLMREIYLDLALDGIDDKYVG